MNDFDEALRRLGREVYAQRVSLGLYVGAVWTVVIAWAIGGPLPALLLGGLAAVALCVPQVLGDGFAPVRAS